MDTDFDHNRVTSTPKGGSPAGEVREFTQKSGSRGVLEKILNVYERISYYTLSKKGRFAAKLFGSIKPQQADQANRTDEVGFEILSLKPHTYKDKFIRLFDRIEINNPQEMKKAQKKLASMAKKLIEHANKYPELADEFIQMAIIFQVASKCETRPMNPRMFFESMLNDSISTIANDNNINNKGEILDSIIKFLSTSSKKFTENEELKKALLKHSFSYEVIKNIKEPDKNAPTQAKVADFFTKDGYLKQLSPQTPQRLKLLEDAELDELKNKIKSNTKDNKGKPRELLLKHEEKLILLIDQEKDRRKASQQEPEAPSPQDQPLKSATPSPSQPEAAAQTDEEAFDALLRQIEDEGQG